LLSVVVAIGTIFPVGSSGEAAASTSPPILATLEGSPVAISEVARLHCHDLARPVIRCYATRRRLDAAAGRQLARRRRLAGSAIQAVAYVRIFEHNDYDGASMLLSTSYSNLGAIGWNDRVSSYRSVNAGSGVFSEHISGGGADTAFCCNAAVTDLGSRNDTFSSVTGSA
jgi:hypothetical protein